MTLRDPAFDPRCDHCDRWQPKQHIKHNRCMPIVGYCGVHLSVTHESGHCAAFDPAPGRKCVAPGARDFLVNARHGDHKMSP